MCAETSDTVTIKYTASSGQGKDFVFDRVFGAASHQEEVYQYAAQPIIQSIVEGYNGTVFAYGQTGSGKTFTMEGPDHTDPELMGVIPRMIGTIFNDVCNADSSLEFTITVSYFEIYMEKIRDLLNPSQDNMLVREHPQKGIWVDGATEACVVSPEEVYSVMQQGAANRATASTNMNERSSRSHSLFLLTLSQTNLVYLSKKSGKLYLVDLAGSEKAGKTGATGEQLEQAKTINKSLTSLGLVITKLTSNADHVPYRDSKLTRVLTESLGGNAKTALVVNCSPAVYNEEETLGTLKFGERAKLIKNKPKVNREQSIPELKALVAKLEKKIAAQQKHILMLEALIRDNGLEVPSKDSAGAEGDGEEVGDDIGGRQSFGAGRRASIENATLEMTKQNALLQERNDELEQQLASESEEKEFMKSLMDDLLEQLAQKENEKKKIQDDYENENIELKSKEADFSHENTVLVQKLAEVTSRLEAAEAINKAKLSAASMPQDLVRGMDETWAQREEALKRSVEESAQKIKESQKDMEKMHEQLLQVDDDDKTKVEVPAEMKAKVAELEGIVTALEKNRDELREEVKQLRESGGASADTLAEAAARDEAKDQLQEAQSELEMRKVLLQERTAEWRNEKEAYVKLHRSLEGQLADLKEQLSKQGQEYEELKVSLMKDLQNRCEKVVELQINLDEARENYHRLLQNSNHRVLSRKVLYLERSLETLKAAYQESVSQKSTLRIDKQVAEKKCEQKEREIKSLDIELKALKEDNRNLKMQLGSGNAYESYMTSVGKSPHDMGLPRMGLRGGGGITKSLRGGGLRGGGASPAVGSPAVGGLATMAPPSTVQEAPLKKAEEEVLVNEGAMGTIEL